MQKSNQLISASNKYFNPNSKLDNYIEYATYNSRDLDKIIDFTATSSNPPQIFQSQRKTYNTTSDVYEALSQAKASYPNRVESLAENFSPLLEKDSGRLIYKINTVLEYISYTPFQVVPGLNQLSRVHPQDIEQISNYYNWIFLGFFIKKNPFKNLLPNIFSISIFKETVFWF